MNITKVPANFFTVAPGVWGRKELFVNFYMIQDLITDEWVLIDSGLKWSEASIKEMATYLFEEQNKPKAIILTHGHFDHVGSVAKMAEEWNVPVFAHHLEIPYLSGKSNYPPPDATVGGGLMAAIAFLYPNSPINIYHHLQVLPPDGSIPVLPEWKYIHTPGHSPGHISLFRESDRVLIAGDAFVTTRQESIISVMLQTRLLSGPPKYFTPDWKAAKASVAILHQLKPKTAATGHGMPMRGKELKKALQELVVNFDEVSIPLHSRYIPDPAVTDDTGVTYLPPKVYVPNETAIKAFAVTTMIVLGFMWKTYKTKRRKRFNEDLLEIEYNF